MLSYCCYQTQIFGMAGIADKDDVSGTRRDTQSLRYSEDREEWNGRKKFHVKLKLCCEDNSHFKYKKV